VSPATVLRRFRFKFSLSSRVEAPFRIRHADGKLGQEHTRGEVIARLKAILPKLEVGARIAVRSSNGETFRMHAQSLLPAPATDIHGTPNVRAWAGIVETTWPKARFAGSCVCKPDSTSHCNGHNDCAAVDYFASWSEMDEMVAYLIHNADHLGVSYLILRDRIWTWGPPRTDSSKGWSGYSGDYHAHVHASFDDGICGVACKPSSQWP